MAITLEWGDFDQTFLIWNFSGRWTAEEFYTVMDGLTTYSVSQPHVINIMVDMRHSLAAPKNLLTLLRVALKKNIRNIGKIVIISQSSFWQQMYGVLVKTTHLDEQTPVTFVPTVDEAYYKIGVYAATD